MPDHRPIRSTARERHGHTDGSKNTSKINSRLSYPHQDDCKTELTQISTKQVLSSNKHGPPSKRTIRPTKVLK